MKKQYNILISERKSVPRSKRMREAGQSASSAAVLVSGTTSESIQGDGHKHSNLVDLERISFDKEDSQYLTVRVGNINEETGEPIISYEKVKAGYADKAGIARDLDEDSPVYNRVLRKDRDDDASGLITFLKGFVSNVVSIFKKGAKFGNFVTGMLGGSGGAITVDENTGKTTIEIDKAIFREEMVTPKITFNCIDAISGDKANTFAFGTIRSVDTANRTIELDLLEDQLGTSKVNDICRGVFHSLEGGNNTSDSVDANGFLNYAGFATAYFTPSEILQNEPGGMRFRYTLQPGTIIHPMSGMNFYAYGNFTDPDRQAMTYETRYYTRRLKDVNTWAIDPTKNISMQDGLLEGLTIGGFVMHGHGTFQENTYLTGVNIQFTPSQIEELQGKSAYNVSLSSYERVVKLDSEGNLTSLYEELNVISGNENVVSGDENVVTSVYNLSTRIQAFKGETELLFSDSVDKDRYAVGISAHGCVAAVSGGILTITDVTDYEECYVDLKINCEGNAVFDKRFSVVVVRNGADGEGSITADFSDEMQSVSCSADGTVTSGLPLTSTFSMYYGSTRLTLDSLSRTGVAGVTVTADKDTGIVTVTAITKNAADTIRIPVTGKATYNGVQYERTIHLSINKVKPGANGENAVIYSLQPSVNVIKRDSSGNSDVTGISCRVLKTDGASTMVSSLPYNYTFEYMIDGASPVRYTPGANISVSGISEKIMFRLYSEIDTSVVLVDMETIYVVRDGKGGIIADLDNAVSSVACNSDGEVLFGLPVTSTFSMYYGTDRLPLSSLTVESLTGVTVTADKDTGIITITAITKNVGDIIKLKVTGTGTYDGTSYSRDLYLTINKVKPGADGENAVIYSLQPSVNVIKRDSSGNSDVASISCRVLKTDGTSTVASSLPYNYTFEYRIDEKSPVKYTSGTDIAVSGISEKILFRLYSETNGTVLIVDMETIYVVQDGTDGHSPYISENGTWMVWDAEQNMYIDSGDPARGDDGHSPMIQNGTWWVWDVEQGKYVDTGIKAKGEDGDPGADGRYTELRYRYAFDKPSTPSGMNPAGWFLSPETKVLVYLNNTGDFVADGNMYVSPTPAADSTVYENRITFVTSYDNQVVDLLVAVSSQAGDYGIVCPVDVAYTDNVSALWKKSGTVSETLSIIVPVSGSHFIDVAYQKNASGKSGEDRFKYRIVYPRTCWLSTAVIDPDTSAVPVWSTPVEFPMDTPDEERVYILTKSYMVVDFPSSDPYTDEYIGEAPAYDSTRTYVRGNIVKYNGAYRVCTSSCTGITPDTASNWEAVGWWTDDPSGAGAEFPYELQCVRKFTDGKWRNYGEMALFVHFAKDGEDGITPLVTQLIPSVTQVGRTMTGSYEPESFTVSHKDTAGNLVKAYMAVWGSLDGNSWTRIGSVENVSSKTVNVAQYPYKHFVIRTYETSTASFSSDYLLSTSVSVLSDGEKGATGATGAMPVYCGFYESGVEYTYTDATRDIINYYIDGSVFTFEVKVHGSTVTAAPTSSTGDENWQPASKFRFVAMDTALIDGANIAGFMYKNLLMKSRLGLLRGAQTDIKDVSEADMSLFRPYLQLDGNNGYMDAMANVRVSYQIIDAGTDLKKNWSWLVLDSAGYSRINNLGNPDTTTGVAIYMHELGAQVFIGNFYWYQISVYFRVQLPKDSGDSSVYSRIIRIRIDPGKMFRGVIIPDGASYIGGGVTYVEEDGSSVHYPFMLCVYPYSELNYVGTTGTNNNIPYYEVVH